MLTKITAIFLFALLALAYKAIQPPPPRTCGSPGGPPITAPRITLRDGRHLAYKEHGVPREVAKKKIVFLHAFGSCRHDTVIATNLPPVLLTNWLTWPCLYFEFFALVDSSLIFCGCNDQSLLEELGAYIVSFDRPGYGESDPDPNRTPKSLALDVEQLADKLGLGPKFYVMGFSLGGQAVWGCLKYIPHRYFNFSLYLFFFNIFLRRHLQYSQYMFRRMWCS